MNQKLTMIFEETDGTKYTMEVTRDVLFLDELLQDIVQFLQGAGFGYIAGLDYITHEQEGSNDELD
jgi:hypothetical protein